MLLVYQVLKLTLGLPMTKKGPNEMHRQALTEMRSGKVGLWIAQVATLAPGIVGKRLRYRDLAA